MLATCSAISAHKTNVKLRIYDCEASLTNINLPQLVKVK